MAQMSARMSSQLKRRNRERGFAHEMSIALQKAGRTKYWLNLLHDGGFLGDEDYQQALEECLELKRLLGSILKKTRGS
ncbi:MAG: four helix bundle protein [Blastocatellia bacterium]|nr:four helix bundle protein [Blastocatellia bacterium]